MVRRSRVAPRSVRVPSGAKAAPYPGFIEPCHPTLRPKPPAGDQWLREIKFDGYRVQAHLRDGKPIIYTRRGYDWTHRFASIAEMIGHLPARHLILDGEVTVDGRGSGDFGALQADLAAGRSDRFTYHAFDLLYLDGYDLRAAPLVERKRALGAFLDASAKHSFIQFVEHIIADAARVYARACDMDLEGIVSKRADAPYRSGRVETWLKAKCSRRDAFVVIGFDPEPGGIAALRLAREVEGKLVYAGKVGTGFTRKGAAELRKILDKLARRTSPVPGLKKPKAQWVEPRTVADVEYLEVSDDGLLRHPSFRGLTARPGIDPIT